MAATLAPLIGCGSDFSLRGQDLPVEDAVFVTETFAQAALPALDVLWVIDDTGSMADEQAALARAFPDFVEALDAADLAWQLGVITTDALGPSAGVLQGDPWIITPRAEDPAEAFARAAAVGTEGLGPVAGIAAMTLALGEPLRSEDNRGFRRPDASLHVVVVSDEDDDSAGILGDDPAAVAAGLLAAEAEATGLPAFLSAVVGDPGTGCQGARGAALPGDTFAEVALASGGAVGSICAGDFDEVIARMGASSVALPTDFPLQSEPWGDSLRVAVDGERRDEGWTLLDATLRFDAPPEAGALIEVRYQVAPSTVSP